MNFLKKDQINWGKQSKQDARDITIIDYYQKNFKKKSLPMHKQYWTMCGDCSDDNNKLRPGSEPDQIIKAGLIKPKQFYGVECNPEIAKNNAKLKGGFNWIENDFVQAMRTVASKKKLNPGIIYYDTISYSDTKSHISYLINMIQFINDIKIRNVMLIVNNIVLGRVKKIDTNRILDPLFQNQMIIPLLKEWQINKTYYEYKSTGKSTSIRMATTAFIKF